MHFFRQDCAWVAVGSGTFLSLITSLKRVFQQAVLLYGTSYLFVGITLEGVLLSEHSIASAWVANEVEAALEKEDRQEREVLFPIRLDETVMHTSESWAATIRRSRHIGDFTNWTEPEAYSLAFERLLRDLKKAEKREK